MIQCKNISVFLWVIGFLSETLSCLSLEAEVGDEVSIWCEHDLVDPGSIFWYKHTSGSVPLLVGCTKFRISAPSEPCYFFTESERIVMSVQGKISTLTITAVNVSDTGLYYCSYGDLELIHFSNSTFIQVKDRSEILYEDNATGSVVFFLLNVVFGIVNVILLCVVIFTALKLRYRKYSEIKISTNTEDIKTSTLNYTALHFSKRTTTRQDERVESLVIYSYVDV